MASSQIVFSNDGEHLAFSSSDGILRIFESATGVLKQEYSSSSHLSTTTTALSWSRQKKELVSTPKTKKRKKDKESEDVYQDDLVLIALGTTAGTVDLYSFAKAQLHTQMTDGHALKVNDLCWHLTAPELFSCSDDQHVVQWDLLKGRVKHKWKCDSSSIHCVRQCSQNNLLTASHTIKLWDISTRTLLQTFTGHSSPIFQLLPVLLSPHDNVDEDGSSYLLSAAHDDRHINVWYCSGSSKDKNSIVTFSVPDEVVSMSLSKSSSSTQSLLLAVITRKGTLHIFEHVFNGKKKKPLLCKVTVQAVSKSGDSGNTHQVPIHGCCIRDDRILLAIGNLFKLQFETMTYNPSNPEVIITVTEPLKSLSRDEYSQVKRPEISAHATTMTPADLQPKFATKNKDKKRLRRSSVSEMTVEERLNAMSSDAPPDAARQRQPSTDTLSKLLQQGLLSGDAKILNGVFQEVKESVVKNTVKNLPLPCIIPLLDQIERGLNGHAQKALNMSRWAVALVTCHTSYILSVPEVINKLNKIYQVLLSRQTFYPKMLQLKGRLDLVKQQGNSQDSEEGGMNIEPLLVHQDDSDDSDSMVIDGPVLESDENWEDLSDME